MTRACAGVLLVGLLLMACGGAREGQAAANGATANLTAHDLAERLIARIRQLKPDARIERLGPLHLRMTEPSSELFLENLDAACQSNPSQCDQRIEMFARTAVFRPDGEVRLEQVLPTLKPLRFIVGAEKVMSERGKPNPLVALPVIDDLFMVLVVDTPDATRMLTQSDVTQLGTTREALAARALDNLRARSNGFKYSEVAPELYGLAANDAYDSASFLLHAEWAAVGEKLGAAPVVVPIGRDIVLFASESSRAGLDALRLILEAEKRAPRAAYPITTQPYRWTPAGWVPFSQIASPASAGE